MNTKIENKLQAQAESLTLGNDHSLNFDLWANKVRPQLLAALKKQGNQIIPLPHYGVWVFERETTVYQSFNRD